MTHLLIFLFLLAEQAPNTPSLGKRDKKPPAKIVPVAKVASSNAPKTVLLDGRLPTKQAETIKVHRAESDGDFVGFKVDQATTDEIERVVFPRHLETLNDCKEGEGSIQSGQYSLRLVNITEPASFSAKDAKQMLYFYTAMLCNVAYAESPVYVVLTEGGKVVSYSARDILKSDGSSIDTIVDVTGDGLYEVVASGMSFTESIVRVSGEVLTFSGKTITQLKELPSLYEDNCGLNEAKTTADAVVIYFQRENGELSYVEERYTAPCGGTKKYSRAK